MHCHLWNTVHSTYYVPPFQFQFHLARQTQRKVIQQWFNGFPRHKIAAENNIGAGTVSGIIVNYKAGLEELEFDHIRELALEARKHGLNLSELALHFRLYNYFIKSGAAEERKKPSNL